MAHQIDEVFGLPGQTVDSHGGGAVELLDRRKDRRLRCVAQGVEVRERRLVVELAAQRPSLEEAFIQLTGREEAK